MEPLSYFDAIPRELQLLILRTVAETWEGKGRWTGEIGGKRQLIRISQVSRSWRELCLDGQLWANVDLAPMAPYLHPRTYRRITDSARTYAKTLNLRGMDSISALTIMPNLTRLDLRGCRGLSSAEICKVVTAPGLEAVNLKGVQGVTVDVLAQLAGGRYLETLDVSRCRSIDLGDMADFLRRSPSELKDLRVAGLSAGGRGGEFARLAKVERLDMLGCELEDGDMELPDTITHLVLSSNPALSVDMFKRLELPNLISLELADMDFFRETPNPRPLIDFLRSTTRLQKLDLDGTGSHGGVNDRVLEALVRFCPNLTELHISHARLVSPDGLIRLIRGCSKLAVLEADVSLALA